MITFACAAFAIVLVVGLCRFLDSERYDHPARQFVRTMLIGFFDFLYAYPRRARQILTGGSLGQPTIWEQTDRPRTKSIWLKAFAWLAFVVIAAFAGGNLAEGTFKETPDAFPYVTKENAWWWGFFGGMTIAAVIPLLAALFASLSVLATLVPVLMVLAILELARRLLLHVFNTAASPRTAPFTYLGALLAVVIVSIALTGD